MTRLPPIMIDDEAAPAERKPVRRGPGAGLALLARRIGGAGLRDISLAAAGVAALLGLIAAVLGAFWIVAAAGYVFAGAMFMLAWRAALILRRPQGEEGR